MARGNGIRGSLYNGKYYTHQRPLGPSRGVKTIHSFVPLVAGLRLPILPVWSLSGGGLERSHFRPALAAAWVVGDHNVIETAGAEAQSNGTDQ